MKLRTVSMKAQLFVQVCLYATFPEEPKVKAWKLGRRAVDIGMFLLQYVLALSEILSHRMTRVERRLTPHRVLTSREDTPFTTFTLSYQNGKHYLQINPSQGSEKERISCHPEGN